MPVSRDTRTGPESATTSSRAAGAGGLRRQRAGLDRLVQATLRTVGWRAGIDWRPHRSAGGSLAALRTVSRGTQPARLTRDHVPRTPCFFSSVPVRTRASTRPLGDSRMFSPPGVVTTRSNPSRVVGSVDFVNIQPSMTTSRHSPRLRLASTGVPAGSETRGMPCGSFRSRVATEISGTCCASRRGTNVRNAPTTQAGSQPGRGLDCGA